MSDIFQIGPVAFNAKAPLNWILNQVTPAMSNKKNDALQAILAKQSEAVTDEAFQLFDRFGSPFTRQSQHDRPDDSYFDGENVLLAAIFAAAVETTVEGRNSAIDNVLTKTLLENEMKKPEAATFTPKDVEILKEYVLALTEDPIKNKAWHLLQSTLYLQADALTVIGIPKMLLEAEVPFLMMPIALLYAMTHHNPPPSENPIHSRK